MKHRRIDRVKARWFLRRWGGELIAVAILSAWFAYNAIEFSDWHCAFVRCVRTENIRP